MSMVLPEERKGRVVREVFGDDLGADGDRATQSVGLVLPLDFRSYLTESFPEMPQQCMRRPIPVLRGFCYEALTAPRLPYCVPQLVAHRDMK